MLNASFFVLVFVIFAFVDDDDFAPRRGANDEEEHEEEKEVVVKRLLVLMMFFCFAKVPPWWCAPRSIVFSLVDSTTPKCVALGKNESNRSTVISDASRIKVNGERTVTRAHHAQTRTENAKMGGPLPKSKTSKCSCVPFGGRKQEGVSFEGVILSNAQFECTIYAFGAHVASWRSLSDLEVFKTKPEFLFVSKKAILDGTKPIRGGIPICFPQFGKLGECTNQHGFARNATWAFVGSEVDEEKVLAKATFTLSSTEKTMKEFPYKFKLNYTVSIEKEFLNTKLEVINEDEKAFEFTTALHTYFGAKSITDIAVKGLNGVRYTDSLEDGKKCVEGEEEIRFDKEVDRIYRRNVALVDKERLEIIDRVWEDKGVLSQHTRGVAMTTKNLNDAVVWNPWIDKAKSMGDFGDEEYKEMVCVEAAAIDEPVKVKPGASWIGEQTLEAVINLAHFSV